MNSQLILHQLRHARARIDEHCAVCHSLQQKFFTCKSCNETIYCGKSCQMHDWETHKKYCLLKAQTKRKREEQQKQEFGGLKEMKVEPEKYFSFNYLPREIVDIIARYLPKRDFDNFRLVEKIIMGNPYLIQQLQRDYVLHITDKSSFPPVEKDHWLRNMQKIRYDGTSQKTLQFIVFFFNADRILKVDLRQYDGDLSVLTPLHNLKVLLLMKFDGNLSPISTFSNLLALLLAKFNGDLSPVSNLTKLKTLVLGSYNRDLDPILNLPNLEVLVIWKFRGDITPITTLTTLEVLDWKSPVADISPLAKLPNLKTLKLHPLHRHRTDWKEYLEALRIKNDDVF